MKIALDWIAEYLSTPIAPDVAEQCLINAGLPLESNEPFGSTHILDVEVTSNRSDCLSHIGLARELAALSNGKSTFKMPAFACPATGGDVRTLTSVTVNDPIGCPYYSARVIQGVKIGPSPAWLVTRLESIGLRSVNNVVDVTNYVLMELGQPLHAFDFDTLHGKKIIVRRAVTGEKIISIDGKTNTLDASMLVIADADRPAAVAGVMGGKDTEVTAATTNILLESARFDPVTIRAQARALTLMSDSSYRFERGIDPAAAERASLRAAELIIKTAGGTLAQGVIAVGSTVKPPVRVGLRLRRVAEVVGIEIPATRIATILAALEFAPEKISEQEGGILRCTVPTHRLDVEREIDLIEEVIRVHGYAHIVAHDRVVHPVQPEPVDQKAGRVIRQALLAAGFAEVVTISFIDLPEATMFLPSNAGGAGGAIRVSDAVRKASNVLRPSLLPSLLQVRRTNQNAGIADARLYEHAETYWQPDQDGKLPPQQQRMIGLIGNSVAEVRGALDLLLARVNPAATLVVTPFDYSWFAPGISAKLELQVGGRTELLGCLGQLAQSVQERYDLRHPCAGAEVQWDILVAAFEPVRRAKPLPRFPEIRRDLSVVLEDAVRWADIAAAVNAAQIQFLEQVDFVGTFRNKQIGPGKKSLTLALEFRDPATTLRSEQVDAQMKSALDLLSSRFGATLRA